MESKPQMAPGAPGPGPARTLRQAWLCTWAVHSRYEGRRVCSRSLAVSAFTESRLSSSSSSSPTAWNFGGLRDMEGGMGDKAGRQLWGQGKAGSVAQGVAAGAEGERSVPVCDGECSRWAGEAGCEVWEVACAGWDFPGPTAPGPCDAHPLGVRSSPALLAPRTDFIVFAQKETPSFPERKLFQDKKSITSTSFLALFLRPK